MTKAVKKNMRSPCPISIGLENFGDKWTLLIIRDLLYKNKRFKDLENSSEHIPTNLLASRLKMLEENNIIIKELYQEKPKRYEYKLLEKGRDMIPVLQSIAKWTIKNVEDCYNPNDKFWNLKSDK